MMWDFLQIYDEFYGKIIRYLERLTGNKQDAEDLSQEVFIKVNRGLAKFEARSSLSTWIYRIATNTAYDRFRSVAFQKGEKKTFSGEFLEDIKKEQSEWSWGKEPIADEQIAEKEMRSCIRRYVDKINESYRTAFILSEYEGLKNKEIADILGLSVETVKIRIHRARTQLRKMMETGCDITREDGKIACDEK